jgi:hydrogenase maturation protein HypF
VSVDTVVPEAATGFRIIPSTLSEGTGALIPPDAAICDHCRREILDPNNRRYRYPFTNCTNCGPRYSIIDSLPYDRHGTSMRDFVMCDLCRREYEDPSDRRFHAQPNACPDCGPQLALWDADTTTLAAGNPALERASEAIRDGLILALKGLGGFQLLVDARNESAVRRLRTLKRRPDKPLAVMYPSLDLIKHHCAVSRSEEDWLVSSAAPIVLLRRLEGGTGPDRPCALTAPGHMTFGVMLPSTPLHLLLLNNLNFPIVATSGNLQGEPICIDENDAANRLGHIADLFLVHNRPILRQVDDSVMRVVKDRPVVIRLGRGLAPAAIECGHELPSLLATGGHEKNAFAVSVGSRIILSQHIGDLDSAASRDALGANVDSLCHLFGVEPEFAACDRHPDYASTRFAESRYNSPLRIQHHLAHVYSCIAEHRIEQPLLGVAWDGSGLGNDLSLWGGEFIDVGPSGYKRSAHLYPFTLPGGEMAVREPRRTALGLLYAVYGSEFVAHVPTAVRDQFSSVEFRLITQILLRSTNCPVTTSAGRLFDGLSSLMGICQRASYEGQAAIALEQVAIAETSPLPYRYTLVPGEPIIVDWRPMVEEILAEMKRGRVVGATAYRVHFTLARIIADVAVPTESETVILTGGCFQNALLLSLCSDALDRNGITAFWPNRTPINDGGLAVGQLLAAARHMTEGS